MLLLFRIFIAAGTWLPGGCLAKNEGYNLRNIYLATIGGIHVQIHRLVGGTYEVFINIGSGIQKLIGGIHGHTDSMVISEAYYFFQNKERRIKNAG
jgi:hypothetical protein